MNSNQLRISQFHRTFPQPLDSSWLIDDINNISTRIPTELRYSGLIFFAIAQNNFYYFDNDLTTPKLFDFTQEINGIIATNVLDYSNVLQLLNSLSPTLGKQILISPLGIVAKWNGTIWTYNSGIYYIDNKAVWDTIPVSLRQRRVFVYSQSDDIYYVSSNSLFLAEEVIILASLISGPGVQTGQVYFFQGDLYFGFNGLLYNLTSSSANQIFTTITNISISQIYLDPLFTGSTNTINHNLGTTNLAAFITDPVENKLIQTEYMIIDANNIDILSLSSLPQNNIYVLRIF